MSLKIQHGCDRSNGQTDGVPQAPWSLDAAIESRLYLYRGTLASLIDLDERLLEAATEREARIRTLTAEIEQALEKKTRALNELAAVRVSEGKLRQANLEQFAEIQQLRIDLQDARELAGRCRMDLSKVEAEKAALTVEVASLSRQLAKARKDGMTEAPPAAALGGSHD
jgi:hypothetical protein